MHTAFTFKKFTGDFRYATRCARFKWFRHFNTQNCKLDADTKGDCSQLKAEVVKKHNIFHDTD